MIEGGSVIFNNLLINLEDGADGKAEEAKTPLEPWRGQGPPKLDDLAVETEARGVGKAAFDIMLIAKFLAGEDRVKYAAHPFHAPVGARVQDLAAAMAIFRRMERAALFSMTSIMTRLDGREPFEEAGR